MASAAAHGRTRTGPRMRRQSPARSRDGGGNRREGLLSRQRAGSPVILPLWPQHPGAGMRLKLCRHPVAVSGRSSGQCMRHAPILAVPRECDDQQGGGRARYLAPWGKNQATCRRAAGHARVSTIGAPRGPGPGPQIPLTTAPAGSAACRFLPHQCGPHQRPAADAKLGGGHLDDSWHAVIRM